MKNNRIISAVISILIGLCIGLAVGNIPTAETTATATETTEKKEFSWLESYNETAENLELFKVYDAVDLTEEMLINRNGDLIIISVIKAHRE